MSTGLYRRVSLYLDRKLARQLVVYSIMSMNNYISEQSLSDCIIIVHTGDNNFLQSHRVVPAPVRLRRALPPPTPATHSLQSLYASLGTVTVTQYSMSSISSDLLTPFPILLQSLTMPPSLLTKLYWPLVAPISMLCSPVRTQKEARAVQRCVESQLRHSNHS